MDHYLNLCYPRENFQRKSNNIKNVLPHKGNVVVDSNISNVGDRRTARGFSANFRRLHANADANLGQKIPIFIY